MMAALITFVASGVGAAIGGVLGVWVAWHYLRRYDMQRVESLQRDVELLRKGLDFEKRLNENYARSRP